MTNTTLGIIIVAVLMPEMTGAKGNSMKMVKLNRNQIKYLVCAAMVLDHIAWAFVGARSTAGQLMLFFGNLTGPVMAYFLAEGYAHTRDVGKYSMRLFLFSLVSWPVYSFFICGHWLSVYFSVFTTLWLGLLAIRIKDRLNAPEWIKALLIILLCIFSILCDWPVYDVLLPLLMFIYRDRTEEKWRAFAMLTVCYIALMMYLGGGLRANLYQLGKLLPYFLLKYCYNGEQGSKHPFHKWFFYVFYPLQFAVIIALGGHLA